MSARPRHLLLIAEPLAPLYAGSGGPPTGDTATELRREVEAIVGAFEAASAATAYDYIATVCPHPFQEDDLPACAAEPAVVHEYRTAAQVHDKGRQ